MKTKVLTAGTFDILHTGHIEYFKAAKALAEGSDLIIIVATDKNSIKIKKKTPINNQDIRLKRVKELNIADSVILGTESNPINSVLKTKPDIIALGYDQWPNEDSLQSELKQKGLNVKIIRMPKFRKEPL